MYNDNSSGTIAKDRLKYMILKERVSCTSETLDFIKQDIIRTISDYIDIDKFAVKVTLEQETTTDNNITYINIKAPIKQ